jgi:hypothetical protein
MNGSLRGIAITIALSFFAPISAANAELIGVFGSITIEASHAPTPQLPGYSTWTVSVTSPLRFVDFEFAPYPTGTLNFGYGFHGPMNQVNPYTATTVFQDANPLFPLVGANPLQDSQFLVTSLSVDRSGFTTFESTNGLGAVFASSRIFGTHVDFAQIVKPDNAVVTFLGRIYLTSLPSQIVSGSLGIVPEPFTITTLVICGLIGIGIVRRR